MGEIKVRHYTLRHRKNGNVVGIWQTTKAMRDAGFSMVTCGPDGPQAWAIAEEWNRRWDAYRAGREVKRWPVGSLGAAFDDLRATGIWEAKKPRTQEDWHRGWRYIGPVFGDVRPATITVAMVDRWYREILKDAGVREGWRAMKIWRALWQSAAAFGYCDKTRDPSQAIRRITPTARSEVWTEGEVTRLAKSAWRRGYHGLAAAIAVAWESGFSPVDVRKLTFAQMDDRGALIGFTVARAKTGQSALTRLGKRASALLRAYLATLPAGQLPAAPIFRNRSGAPYSKDTLGDDFRDIRGAAETRWIADIRRSGAVEALAGGASDEQIGAKLANSISTNAELRRTYLPAHEATVRLADEARKRGRRNIRNTKV